MAHYGQYTVSICMVDRAYGGPEEGGWWYDVSAPCDEYASYTRGFEIQASAHRYADRLEKGVLANLNAGRRPLSSVISTGIYRAIVFDGNPRQLPVVKPHYE